MPAVGDDRYGSASNLADTPPSKEHTLTLTPRSMFGPAGTFMRSEWADPIDGEASREIYTGTDPTTSETLWTLERVDEHPQDGTYVRLRAVDERTGDGFAWTTDTHALRGLASVLLAQAQYLDIEDHQSSASKSAHRHIEALMTSWEVWAGGDPWDLAAGLVAGHQQFTDRIAHFSTTLLAALDGDERAADLCKLEVMSGPQRDQDIADVLDIPVEELRTRLSAWAELGQMPGAGSYSDKS